MRLNLLPEPADVRDDARRLSLPLDSNLAVRRVHPIDATDVSVQPAGELTAREREILHWTALGKTSGEVGMILGVATRTITFHIARILVKLEAKNKIQAVVKALQLNLIHVVWPSEDDDQDLRNDAWKRNRTTSHIPDSWP
jgi:DNA-binding CsgD family transcriptional regulator